MVQVTYPGVYIQEIPSGVHTITSVATSITAFIDFFKEGPMDKAVEIFGMTDFQRIFGGLDNLSEASYAISQFFLNGGSTALVVRCASANITHPLDPATVDIGGGSANLTVSAVSPGAWGNTLRVDIDHRTADPTKFFNMTVTRYDPKSGIPVAQEQYNNLSLDDASSRFAPTIVNAQSHLVQLEVPPSTTGVPAANGTQSGDLSGLTQGQLDAFSGKTLKIAVGASATYKATLPTWKVNVVTGLVQLASRLETALRTAVDTSGTPGPTPPALTGASVYVLGGKALVVRAGRGDPDCELTDIVVVTNDAGTTGDDLALTAAHLAHANVQQYPLGSSLPGAADYIKGTSGADGLPPDADAICGAVAQANQKGMFALDKVDLFNILCIPRAAEIVNELNGEAQMQTIVSHALAYCKLRRAFFILDIPKAVDKVATMKDWLELDTHASFRNNNAAIYFPRLQIPDPLNEYRLRSVAASGTMAGVYSRTDSDRGVWKAPAGIETVLNGVSVLDYKMNDAENGTLNPLGINCMRIFPIYGTISWGARTLEGADAIGSEWKYIPIRRLALMLEESLFRGTKWVVFEPNDEPLWAKIRLNVGAYMMSLFRQGAFQGTSPKDAFFVKCDAETTTQDDRNKGIVNILVGFAPLKPAEFVVISIQQIAGQL